MRLDFFMLADSAAASEGKIYIHGGAITRVTASTFPSSPIPLSAVARFLADADEPVGLEREVVIDLRRVEDAEWTEMVRAIVRHNPQLPVKEGEDQGVLIVASMLIGFERPARYEVRLRLGEEISATRRLLVLDSQPRDA